MDGDTYDKITEFLGGLFEYGEYAWVRAVLTEMLSYPLSDDQLYTMYTNRSVMNGYLKDYDAGIEDLRQVVALGLADASIYEALCWNIGINAQPEKALQYCEKSVQLDASSLALESRGLVYAQLGRYEDASVDFQQVVDSWGTPEDDVSKNTLAEKQEWLKLLKAGKNPFTPAVLKDLQADMYPTSDSPTPSPAAPLEITRVSLQERIEEIGFEPFEAMSGSWEQPAMKSTLDFPGCSIAIILVGPEENLDQALWYVSGCTPEDRQNLAYHFATQSFLDKTEQAKAFTWLMLETPYLDERTFPGVIKMVGDEGLQQIVESAAEWTLQKDVGNNTLYARVDPHQEDVFHLVVKSPR